MLWPWLFANFSFSFYVFINRSNCKKQSYFGWNLLYLSKRTSLTKPESLLILWSWLYIIWTMTAEIWKATVIRNFLQWIFLEMKGVLNGDNKEDVFLLAHIGIFLDPFRFWADACDIISPEKFLNSLLEISRGVWLTLNRVW